MHLKNAKSNFGVAGIVIVLIVLSFLTFNNQQYVIVKEDLMQNIEAQNLGFSHLRTLVDTGEGQRAYSSLSKLKGVIGKIPEMIKYKLSGGTDFERIDIEIDFLEYAKILKDRERAIQDQILTNPTKVKSVLKFQGKDYKARVRLKGDLHHHWDSKLRLSLRVELKGGKNIFGFSNFSIHKPRERKHPYDYAFQSMVRDTGNLASVHKFAHIFVNGEDWGIMDIEEHMSKEFVEKQNKKSTILFRFSNEDLWRYGRDSKNPYRGYRLSDSNLYSRVYDKKTLQDEQNRKIYSYISKKTFTKDINLYDIEAFSNALITTLAWNNTHTLADTNSRYYFNPYTLKIEPVTADQGSWWTNEGSSHLEINEKYLQIITSDIFKENLPKNIERISKIVLEIDDYLSFNDSLFPVDIKKNTSFVKNQMKKIINNQKEYVLYPLTQKDINNRLENPSNVSFLQGMTVDLSSNQAPPSAEQASEFPEHIYIRHNFDGSLEIHNLIQDNVVIKNIYYDGMSVNSDNQIIITSYKTKPQPTIINTEYTGIQDNKFSVTTEYQGFTRTSQNTVTLYSDNIRNPLLVNNENKFNFLTNLNDLEYEIKKGVWNVNSPIVINGDLKISPGAKLQFSKDAYIIIKGSLNAIGTELNPIHLSAIESTWKGLYVLNASKKSFLKHVMISDLSATEDDLLKLTGGLTFYKSDVLIENIRIQNVQAEDALNIVESKFILNAVVVKDTISDGLDSDFSDGTILNSEFSGIGGDALDFSGSVVSINKTKVFDTRDKAVSGGEKSTLTVSDSSFFEIGVGIASKDGSFVTVADTEILDYQLHGAMAYRKKSFYDMPSLIINDTVISGAANQPYMRESGASMIVNGLEVAETQINVENLYESEVMSK